jgi:hypothetical protein
MDEPRKTPDPVDRATAELCVGPDPSLCCSNCGGPITDADADCQTCESPIDWGASQKALMQWQQSTASA